MEKKFNLGDRVRSKFYGIVGTITEIDTDGYILKPDADDDMWIADTDVEPYDPKTAFLSELKGLLIKHNADIWMDSIGFDDNFLRIDINGAEKQSFKVENSVILHDEEIKIEPLEPNWY